MWRRSCTEEWERRKSYLIRSLFEDLPILSPVPETEERYTTSPVLPPAAARPCSPLPPLIIEPEPNRHDEPEAFYIQLERKMKHYYIKLFLENQTDVDSSEVGSHFKDDAIRHVAGDVGEESESNDETDDAVTEDVMSETDREIALDVTGHEADDESASGLQTDPSQTSSDPDYEQVTFEADVHVEASQHPAIDTPPSLVYDVETAVWREPDIRVHCPDEARAADVSNVPEVNRVPDNIHFDDSDEDYDDIEPMRTPRNCPSVGSLLNETYNISYSESITAEHRERLLEPHSDSNAEGNVIRHTDYNLEFCDNVEVRTSTPRREENDDQRLLNHVFVNASVSTPKKRKRNASVAIQTSLDEGRPHQRVVPDSFFIGSPKIFRLCSCRNHSCIC